MNELFRYTSYSKNIAHWDFSSVTNLNAMFSATNNWNHPVNWSVPSLSYAEQMFEGSTYNQPVTFRNSYRLQTLRKMFYQPDASSGLSRFYTVEFNQPVTIEVTDVLGDFYHMFLNNQAFNNRFYPTGYHLCNSYAFEKMFTGATGMSSCSKYHMNQVPADAATIPMHPGTTVPGTLPPAPSRAARITCTEPREPSDDLVRTPTNEKHVSSTAHRRSCLSGCCTDTTKYKKTNVLQ